MNLKTTALDSERNSQLAVMRVFLRNNSEYRLEQFDSARILDSG